MEKKQGSGGKLVGMKDIISESLILKLLYMYLGVTCINGIFTFLRKLFWSQNGFLQIMCAILTVVNYFTYFICFALLFLFCYLNKDHRFWSGFLIFSIVLKSFINTFKNVRINGWRGLM